MSDLIESFLETHGPCLSSGVAEHLVVTLGISPVAARKRVSRLAGNVRRLRYITFPRKARYMYLEQQFGSDTSSRSGARDAYDERMRDAADRPRVHALNCQQV